MSEAWNNIYANVALRMCRARDEHVEQLARRAVHDGYAALSLEYQDCGMRPVLGVCRILAGGRVVARVETVVTETTIEVVPYWLGDEPNSDEDEARRRGE